MRENAGYIGKLLAAVAVFLLAAVLLLFVTHLAYVLLLVFASLLFAIFIDGLSAPLEHYAHLPRKAAVGVVMLAVLSSLTAVIYLIGPAIAEQAAQLIDRLPRSVQRLRDYLSQYEWGQWLIESARSQWDNGNLSAGAIASRLTGTFSTVFGVMSDALIILVIGFYLAFHPAPYRNGFLALFPTERRARLHEVLSLVRNALRWWLVGRGLSMLVVGMLTGVGLWIIGLPLVLALAVLAGLLSFVPFLGPIAAAIPAILVGLIDGLGQAANVILVYAVVQFLESNIITPLIQVRAVSLPPAVMLTSQVLMSVLFGLMGVLLATPLMVSIIVLIQLLYVNDLLGDDVAPLGS